MTSTGYKLCITKIHLGRYRLDMLDNDNQIIQGYDCGLAGILVALNNWLFIPEHLAYPGDQRKSSDQLGDEAIAKMKAEARIAEIDKMFEAAKGWGSWMVEAANERKALANRFGFPHKYQAQTAIGGRVD